MSEWSKKFVLKGGGKNFHSSSNECDSYANDVCNGRRRGWGVFESFIPL
jgi:hypothetical protein